MIGLGTFGTTVASELVRFGNHVLGIDTVERNVATSSRYMMVEAFARIDTEEIDPILSITTKAA